MDRSRNFVIGVLAYGPSNAEWRENVVRLAASYPHVARPTLRSPVGGAKLARTKPAAIPNGAASDGTPGAGQLV